MRSGAAAGHRGYFHECALYASDEEFVEIVVPFLADGIAAGEPTLAALGEKNGALVRSAMPDSADVTFLPTGQYARPAPAIKKYRDLLTEYVAKGASQIRIVGEVPHPGVGEPWDWWARYEAAINYALDDYPLWGMCPYDVRVTPGAVLADVERTHPHVAATGGRHTSNLAYQEPSALLCRRSTTRDLLETGPATIELPNPTPAAARHAVTVAASRAGLTAEGVSDMVFAASEAVSNALYHGRPPVLFRLWVDVDRMVVTVSDSGPGPADPLTGLLPVSSGSSAGLGLWIAHNVCDYVAMDRGDGFTIRLIVGRPALVG